MPDTSTHFQDGTQQPQPPEPTPDPTPISRSFRLAEVAAAVAGDRDRQARDSGAAESDD